MPQRRQNTAQGGDRFIPTLSHSDRHRDRHVYRSLVAAALAIDLHGRILSFYHDVKRRNIDISLAPNPANPRRLIPNHPELVLDAHGLKKDWSLNNLDWSSKDHVAIGLGGDVFIWDAISYTTTRLGILDGSYISSVKWVDHGAYIAAAVSSGNVQIWDVESKPVLRTMETPEFRVPVMSWENTSVVSTGTSSGII